MVIICILFPEWLPPCYCSLEVITPWYLEGHRGTYVRTMNSSSESVENIAQVPFSVSGWIFPFRRQYFKGTRSGPCVCSAPFFPRRRTGPWHSSLSYYHPSYPLSHATKWFLCGFQDLQLVSMLLSSTEWLFKSSASRQSTLKGERSIFVEMNQRQQKLSLYLNSVFCHYCPWLEDLYRSWDVYPWDRHHSVNWLLFFSLWQNVLKKQLRGRQVYLALGLDGEVGPAFGLVTGAYMRQLVTLYKQRSLARTQNRCHLHSPFLACWAMASPILQLLK